LFLVSVFFHCHFVRKRFIIANIHNKTQHTKWRERERE
jgi:hypothetical protein